MNNAVLPPLSLEPLTPPGTAFDRERERIHRQMLSSVSHDLKTPLASIIGSLEVYERMKDKLPAEKQATLIKVALQEAHRLDAFITNILDMAKLENDMVKPKSEKVDIGAMLRDSLLRLNYQLQGSKVDFKQLPEKIETSTDAVLLSRAVGLVLDNAIRYGGKPAVIQVEYGKAEDGLAYIRISDNGLGIPEDRIETIFMKYTRFTKEDQQNAGTGLGLAIAREIMRLLEGRIIATNDHGKGAVISLHFPMK